MSQPVLLFIHGFRGSHEGLAEICDLLTAQGYKCFAPDIPPFGAENTKSPTPSHYDTDFYANFIADYIKSHQIKRPVLIGHSMGSVIAAATAAKYPDLISQKLILMAPISVKPSRPIAALQPLVTILPNKLVGYITTKYLFIPKNRKLFRKTLKITYVCSKYYTSKAAVRQAAKFSTRHAISDFNFLKDTLLLSGAQDRLIAKKYTDKLANKIHAKTIYLEDTGHLLNYEDPQAVADIIQKFL